MVDLRSFLDIQTKTCHNYLNGSVSCQLKWEPLFGLSLFYIYVLTNSKISKNNSEADYHSLNRRGNGSTYRSSNLASHTENQGRSPGLPDFKLFCPPKLLFACFISPGGKYSVRLAIITSFHFLYLKLQQHLASTEGTMVN